MSSFSSSADRLENALPESIGLEDVGEEHVVLAGEPVADFDDVAHALSGDEEDWVLLYRVNFLNFPDPIVLPSDGRTYILPSQEELARLKQLQLRLNEEGV
jgi:hypothetical protein